MICSCLRRWKVYCRPSPWTDTGRVWIAVKGSFAEATGYDESRPFSTWREAFDWAFQRVEMERQKHDAHFTRERLYGRG